MQKTMPSDDSLSIPVLLRHARETYTSAFRSALEQHGHDDIPRNGHYVIAGLAVESSGRPLGQLIDGLRISKQAAGQLVDALVVRGYLKREVDETDRRKFTIGLTERGRKAARVLRTTREAIDAELTNRAGPLNVRRLRQALSVLVDLGRESHGQSGT